MSRWIARQQKDIFVRARDEAQYVSRAAFKLEQLNQRFGFLDPSKRLNILDLGAAPGGWIQVCVRNSNKHNILGIDLLPLHHDLSQSSNNSYKNVTFHQQDLLDPATPVLLDSYLKENNTTASPYFHLILSDMLANVSGSSIRDAAASIRLISLATSLAQSRLLYPNSSSANASSSVSTNSKTKAKKTYDYDKHGGMLILKALQSKDADDFVRNTLKPAFDKVSWVKPSASRSESREAYLVCRGPVVPSSSS